VEHRLPNQTASGRGGVQPRLETWRTQLSCTTGFVTLHRWARILERHFPPEPLDPDHATLPSTPKARFSPPEAEQ
jgi:hypothetical protein